MKKPGRTDEGRGKCGVKGKEKQGGRKELKMEGRKNKTVKKLEEAPNGK